MEKCKVDHAKASELLASAYGDVNAVIKANKK